MATTDNTKTPTSTTVPYTGYTSSSLPATVTTTPVVTPAPVVPTTPTTPTPGATPSPDGYYARSTPGADAATSYLGTFKPPVSEDEAFNKYRKETQALIDTINQSYDRQVAQTIKDNEANAVGAGTEAAIAGGNAGASAARMRGEADPKIASIETQRRADIEKVNQGIISSAEQYAKQSKIDARQSAGDVLDVGDKLKNDATNSIKTLASAHTDWENYKQSNPQAYQALVTSLGGDSNIADAIYANSIPKQDVLQQYINGSKVIQVTQDPVTRKVSTQSYDIGVDLPKNWQQQKIGTNSVLFYDPNTFNPNDPSTFKMFATDPLTGMPVVTSGTQASTSTTPGGMDIVTATSTAMGIPETDLGVPTSQAVDQYGLGNIVAGLIAQEGGSPKGVENNPGNIKFVGLPGQVDSGVKATDGGTFASYATKEDGIRAVGELVVKAGDKPLQDFIASYKGVSPDAIKLESPKSGSILSATGISTPVFNYLTGGTATMSRMSAAQRNQIMNQATEFLNKNGIDISTFQSQYKAYNDVLSANIQRANKTKIMESELIGTIDNLKGVVKDADLGSVSAANVAKVLLGEQVNDPLATQYAFHFQQLQNELAGYFAASQGKNSPDVIDNKDAADAIAKGMATGSLDGLRTSIENSTSKMGSVLQKSVDSSRKDVWDLFGVGDKYQTQFDKDSSQVNKVLSSKGINYNDFVSKAPTGSIPVIKKDTGEVGYIPVEEYVASIYTRI
jgi:hypothetical protein